MMKCETGPFVRWCGVLLLAIVASGVVQLAVTLQNGVAPAAAQPAQRDLMETIRAEARFSTLVRVVETAGLVDMLKAPGPYTFFAPTNDAFNKLAPGALDTLLKDPEALRRVVLSHLSPGYVTAAQAVQVPTLTDARGAPISVGADGASVSMNNARVTQPDLLADNGVIHVLDTVWVAAAANPRTLPTAGAAEDQSLSYTLIGTLLLACGLFLLRRRAAAAHTG
jgi:uncharacterized surface protein with fasciclin (FAS1) repeats